MDVCGIDVQPFDNDTEDPLAIIIMLAKQWNININIAINEYVVILTKNL